jgi:hypothetical protein
LRRSFCKALNKGNSVKVLKKILLVLAVCILAGLALAIGGVLGALFIFFTVI